MLKAPRCFKAFLAIAILHSTSVAEEVPITIETIRCQKTESVSGPDKAFYVIAPKSGKGVASERHTLNDNQAWRVNRKVLSVERGVPVGVTVWDGDRYYDKHKDTIAGIVGTAVGSLGGGKTGQEFAERLLKKLEDPSDLVLSAIVNTDEDGFFVLCQRRGSKTSGSQSFYVVTLRVGSPKKQTYELTLNRIKCSEQEDNWGDDHAYIKVAGKKVWGRKMDDDKTRTIKDLKVRFTDTDIIELWEEDDADDDDHLGTHAIAQTTPITAGSVRYDFREDGARYRVDGQIRKVTAPGKAESPK